MSTYHEPSLLLGDGDMTPNKTDKPLISGALEFMSSSFICQQCQQSQIPTAFCLCF